MSVFSDFDFFTSFLETAISLAKSSSSDAVLILIDDPLIPVALGSDDRYVWLQSKMSEIPIGIVAHDDTVLEKVAAAGLSGVKMDVPDAAVQERLTQAILDSVAAELLQPGATVVAVYSSFDLEQFDSISTIKLTEHLGRLTARDLQNLETKVPLETLKVVVELAVEIGREGREGKPVGTMMVVGDHRRVLGQSRLAGFDPMKGYVRRERNLNDSRVREGIKEIAQMDGAFIIAADGTVESCCRIIDTAPVEITMTTGLGTRHYAGAAISKNTEAVAVVVSESSGTVRIYQNGEVVLRIEPLRRAMKWKDAPKKSTELAGKPSGKKSK